MTTYRCSGIREAGQAEVDRHKANVAIKAVALKPIEYTIMAESTGRRRKLHKDAWT
jgi:hypothetical protein